MNQVEPGPEVLIVDDLAGTRAVLRDMLEELGYKDIEEAADGREALEKLEKRKAQLVISDHSMQDMSGLDLLLKLRTLPHLFGIPFIMCSAQADLPVIENAMKLGVSAYIVKPIRFDTLQLKISEVMRRRHT